MSLDSIIENNTIPTRNGLELMAVLHSPYHYKVQAAKNLKHLKSAHEFYVSKYGTKMSGETYARLLNKAAYLRSKI